MSEAEALAGIATTERTLSAATLAAAVAEHAPAGGGGPALTPVDIDCTGGELAVGELARLDLSGCTADVVLTLPPSTNSGAQLGILIVGTSADHEAYIDDPELIGLTAGQSRIWQVGERLEVCDCAAGWVVRVDGRKKTSARVTLADSTQSWPAPSAATPIFDVVTQDRGGIWDAAGQVFRARRDGAYLLGAEVLSGAGLPGEAKTANFSFVVNGTPDYYRWVYPIASRMSGARLATKTLVAGDTVSVEFSNGVETTVFLEKTNMSIQEQ
jgi:hypothetical protein